MKQVLMGLIALLVCLGATSQTVQPSEKVLASGINLVYRPADAILELNFEADHMYVISSNPEKASALPLFSPEGTSFTESDYAAMNQENFNPLLYNLKSLPGENQYYRLGNTGKTLFVYSTERLEVLYQRAIANR